MRPLPEADKPTPSEIQSETRKAQEEFRSGRIDAASARIDRLRFRHPNHPDVLAAVGMIHIARGDQESAYESFCAALAVQPDAPETLAWAAFIALNLRRFAEAEAHASRLVSIVPTNQKGHYLLANALRSQDRIEEALAEIDRALELNPNDTDSLVTKARLLQTWQMPALATELYRKAMAIRPTPAAGVELAEMLLRDTHPEEAFKTLNEISPAMPKQARPYAMVAEALMQMKRYEEAEESWALAKTYSHNPVGTSQARARSEIAAGRFELAEEILKELIEQGLDLAASFSILSTGKKMRSEDLPLIERAAEIPLDSIDISLRIDLCYALGKCFDDVRDYERAIESFDEANRYCMEAYGRRRAFDRERTRAFTDYLIELSDPDRIRKWSLTGLESRLPLFVAGMMRSGTTLTETILSAHSKIKGWGEQAFWTERVVEFVQLDQEGGFHFDHEMALGFAEEYLRNLDPKDPSIRYVTDKNPGNYELAAILHSVLPNAKFVHLKRHPVDNLLSIWMTPLSANVRFASDRSNLVFTYREHMRLVKRWSEVLPADRFRSFRYEDLTSDPKTMIGAMLDFLNLEHEEACFSPETNQRYVLTPSVHQVRQPIHRGSQERWKNYEPWLGEFAELLEDPECL